MLTIVGCGPGSPEYITPKAKQAVLTADQVLGWQHTLSLFPETVNKQLEITGIKQAIELLTCCQEKEQNAAVLVSGDVGVFSLARRLIDHFGQANCQLIAGISAVQIAAARLALDWTKAIIVSAHAQIPSHEDYLALTTASTAFIYLDQGVGRDWAASVVKQLENTHQSFLCSRLTLPGELIRAATETVVLQAEFPSLLTLLRK